MSENVFNPGAAGSEGQLGAMLHVGQEPEELRFGFGSLGCQILRDDAMLGKLPSSCRSLGCF